MRNILKVIGIVVGVLVALVVALLVLVFVSTNSRVNATYSPPVDVVEIPTDAAAIAEGERLFTVRGCIGCHGSTAGGEEFIPAPIGPVYAPNLTPGEGGAGATFSDEDFVRAIRYGVSPTGRAYLIMPSHEFWYLSDSDVGHIVAYVRSLPPVDNVLPESQLGILGRVIVFTAPEAPFIPAELIDFDAERPANVAAAPTAEYGEILVKAGCVGCHSPNLAGGPIPGGEPGFEPANITSSVEYGIGDWTLDEFAAAMRNGVAPDGSQIDPQMPWQEFNRLTDVEVEAMYAYLLTVPAVDVDPWPEN